MRAKRILLGAGLALSLMPLFFVGCGGDDSTDAPDTGADTAVVETGGQDVVRDTSSDTAIPCGLCVTSATNGTTNLCRTNGPPSSYDLAVALVNCFCDPGNSCSGGACSDTCSLGTQPSNACNTCIDNQCATELHNCVFDTGNGIPDSGPPDASDAGDASDSG